MIVNSQLKKAQIENIDDATVINKASGSATYNVDRDELLIADISGKVARLQTEIVIGTAADKVTGRAQYDETELQAAITAAVAGDTIRILETTFTGVIVIDKKLCILGDGSGSIIAGTVALNAGSDGTKINGVRFEDDITVAAGVTETVIMDSFISAGGTITMTNIEKKNNVYLLIKD